MNEPVEPSQSPFRLPEERRRIGTTMRFLVDMKGLYLDGMRIVAGMFEAKVPTVEVGMRLVDFERALRMAANELPRRPLHVVHADALWNRETKLDSGLDHAGPDEGLRGAEGP